MRQISQCFDTKLARLFKEAAALDALSAQVKRHVGDIPCTVSRYHQGTLTLNVQDAVWATRLRYEIPMLRDKLRREGLHQLTSIRVSLSPTNKAEATKKPVREVHISHEAKKIIQESAKHSTYEPLKKALARLSENAHASDKTKSGDTSGNGSSSSG